MSARAVLNFNHSTKPMMLSNIALNSATASHMRVVFTVSRNLSLAVLIFRLISQCFTSESHSY
ncbi:MAG: hypothetical protein WCO86_19465, partial [Planctomycetota bacterium]